MQKLLARMDWEQLKVPLGFVRVLELVCPPIFAPLFQPHSPYRLFQVFCIIGYAALTSWEFDLTVTCKLASTVTLPPDSTAPTVGLATSSLRLGEWELKRCDSLAAGTNVTAPLFTDGGGARGYYSTLLFLSALITAATLLVYLGWWPEYTMDERLPTADMILTSILAFTWLVATFAFSLAVRQIKASVTAENVEKVVTAGDWCKGTNVEGCEVKSTAMTSLLSVAVICGVANVLLYAVNVWFVYKETPSFKARTVRGVQVHQQEPYTLE